ncbi:uncharacterized protein LOC135292737 [Passer domesticus]|uniref:uncharacterized protein LOC135292737 n=1 Tax=Passer domesticus TaxID=48849 RepID=UPI0030FE19AD
MGSQEVLMNDGLKFLEDAGAEPAGEGPTSRTEALGDAEGVSAGRTSPAPALDAQPQPSSHGRGSPTGKIQDRTDQISLEPPKQTKQELKEMWQGGQEMKGEPVHMEALPRGSSGSMPASAAGREAMPDPGPGDEVAGKASPLAWMNKVSKPLEPPADVSTGRTSPAPTLEAAQKPSSHQSGKIQDTTDNISLEPSKQMRQELKELLQTRQEMDIVLQWKVAFLEGSTPSSVPASAAGKKAMPDTGTGTADWDAGKDSPLAWRYEVVKPSGHSADVSAGTTSPTPTLDAAQKASSHHRSPTIGETKDMAGKKFQDPLEIMWQMLKERLQRKQEMKGEPVHMEALPRGSSGSVPASAAGREAVQGTGTGDEVAGKASPLAWMNKVSKPLEPPADVSTGRTSPAPTLEAAQKPSSHQSVTPTGKIQDTTDNISLEPSKQMRQELKELLQTRQEMDIVLQWKVAFLEGSTPSSVPASAAGKKAMPDTGTGTADWDAGKDSPLAWRYEVLKPSGHSADVSAGTTSPTPTLDDAQKPSSHGRGPTIGETKDMAGKKFQDPLEIMWQMLKERLQRKQEMKGEPVHMEALPRGSSGSMPASAAGREAMPGTGTGDEGAGKASPSAWMNKVLKPLEPPADVSTGRTSPSPTLDFALKPSSHHRGTPAGKIQDRTDKISLESPKEIRQELKDLLQTRQEMKGEPVEKEAFPGGSRGFVATSAAGRETMPGTDTGDWNRDMGFQEVLMKDGLKFLEDAGAEPAGEGPTSRTEALGDAEGVSAGRRFIRPLVVIADKTSSHHSGSPTGKIQNTRDKISLEPSKQTRQVLKKMLQGGQEIKGEPVQKEAFPGGSSGSVPASAAGREAMPGTGTGAEPAGEGPTSRTEALGDAEDVSAGRTSPGPGLDAWPQPSSHGRVPPKGKTQVFAAKKTHDSDEFLRETQKEAPGGQVTDQKAVQEEEHSGRSSGSLAALAAGRKAMTDTGTGTADAAGTTRPVPNAQDGLGRGFCQGTGCWLGLLPGVLCLELVFMLCCFGIGYSWNRKQSTSGHELEDGGCTSHPDSVSSSSSSRNGLDSPLKCSVKRTPEQQSTREPPLTL